MALLNLSSWCLVMVERLFLALPWVSLQFVIVVVPDHIHLLLLKSYLLMGWSRPDAVAVVRPTGAYLLDFFCSGIQFSLLLSPYLYSISFI